ncbi:hypothetical protein KBB06_02530 [Candidatus Gracilibacteria bacterium]|nr:hypothetical protein [Candidatus Gracilibacteria bacterium]
MESPKAPNNELQQTTVTPKTPNIPKTTIQLEGIKRYVRNLIRRVNPLAVALSASLLLHTPYLAGQLTPHLNAAATANLKKFKLGTPKTKKIAELNKQREKNKEARKEELALAKAELVRKINAGEDIDPTQVILDTIEYLEQGVEQEVIQNAKSNLQKKTTGLTATLPKEPDLRALKTIMESFSPAQSWDPQEIRSVAADSLACNICPESQICDSGNKIIVMAFAKLYPGYKNSIYIQRFPKHVRPLIKLGGKTFVMETDAEGNIHELQQDSRTGLEDNVIMSFTDYLKIWAGLNAEALTDTSYNKISPNSTLEALDRKPPRNTDSLVDDQIGKIFPLATATPDEDKSEPVITIQETPEKIDAQNLDIIHLSQDTLTQDQIDSFDLVINLQNNPELDFQKPGKTPEEIPAVISPSPELIQRLIKNSSKTIAPGDVAFYDPSLLETLLTDKTPSTYPRNFYFKGLPSVLMNTLKKMDKKSARGMDISIDLENYTFNPEEFEQLAKLPFPIKLFITFNNLDDWEAFFTTKNIDTLAKSRFLEVTIASSTPFYLDCEKTVQSLLHLPPYSDYSVKLSIFHQQYLSLLFRYPGLTLKSIQPWGIKLLEVKIDEIPPDKRNNINDIIEALPKAELKNNVYDRYITYALYHYLQTIPAGKFAPQVKQTLERLHATFMVDMKLTSPESEAFQKLIRSLAEKDSTAVVNSQLNTYFPSTTQQQPAD